MPQIEQHCYTLSSKLSKIFPHFALHWIPHRSGKRIQVLRNKGFKFETIDGGDILKNQLEHMPLEQRYTDVVQTPDEHITEVYKKNFTSFYYLDLDKLEPDNMAIHQTYRDIFIYLSRARESGGDIYFPAAMRKDTEAIIGNNNLKDYIINMAADIFASTLNMTSGDRTALLKLAQYRSRNLFKKEIHSVPENYPFPLAESFIHTSMKNQFEGRSTDINHVFSNKKNILHHMNTSLQIALSIPDYAYHSWIELSRNVQFLIWAKVDIDTIHKTAINHSFSPHILALAKQVFLHKVTQKEEEDTPQSPSSQPFYNPFLDQSSNKANHRMTRLNTCYRIVNEADKENGYRIFDELIEEQNENFISGNICGWCVKDILKLKELYQQERQSENFEEKRDAIINNPQTRWNTLQEASWVIFEHRRAHKHLDVKKAAEILNSH